MEVPRSRRIVYDRHLCTYAQRDETLLLFSSQFQGAREGRLAPLNYPVLLSIGEAGVESTDEWRLKPQVDTEWIQDERAVACNSVTLVIWNVIHCAE